MNRVTFETAPRARTSAYARMDVACFVGFVRRREGAPVTERVRRALVDAGWADPPAPRFDQEAPLHALTDLPIPIDRFEDFERLFAWERLDDDAPFAAPLGAAVRSFFAQGGRRCHVVPLAAPSGAWSLLRALRVATLAPLLLPLGTSLDVSLLDRPSLRGASHVFALPDVSILCMPDLPVICASDVAPPTPGVALSLAEESFVECSEPAPYAPPDAVAVEGPAPACDAEGYDAWATLVARAAALLGRFAREVQLVAALPRPRGDAMTELGAVKVLAEDDLFNFLLTAGNAPGVWPALLRLQSPFVQLAYPWVITPGSARLPGGVEPPDGVLAGLLARSALARGAFRSAMNLDIADVQALSPVLDRRALEARPRAPVVAYLQSKPGPGVRRPPVPDWPFVDRVSVVGPTPSGLRLLSDVTTSPDEQTRQGGLRRLFAVIAREARRAGAEVLFEPSGERTWSTLVSRLEAMFTRLWELGALRGDTASAAYAVRCDRTTMSQADIDAGRLVAELEFAPASTIERVRVVLVLSEGAQAWLRFGEGT